MEKLKMLYEKINWEVVEKNLDKEIEDMEASDDINWVFDLLLKVEKPTLEDMLSYYEERFIYLFNILTNSIYLEKYEVSAKVRILMDYLNQEMIRIGKIHLEEDDMDEIVSLISMTRDIKLSTINQIINIKSNEKKV